MGFSDGFKPSSTPQRALEGFFVENPENSQELGLDGVVSKYIMLLSTHGSPGPQETKRAPFTKATSIVPAAALQLLA